MFLANRNRENRESPAMLGAVTVAGNTVGAYLEGERRGMRVFSPGGYYWMPDVGEEVLVIKTGEQGEKPCVVGCAGEEVELEKGEVLISTGKAAVRLSPDGDVTVTGRLTVNGVQVGPLPPEDEDDDEEEN